MKLRLLLAAGLVFGLTAAPGAALPNPGGDSGLAELAGWMAAGWSTASDLGAVVADGGDGFAPTGCGSHFCVLMQLVGRVAGQRYTLNYATGPEPGAGDVGVDRNGRVDWDGVERHDQGDGVFGWVVHRVALLLAAPPATVALGGARGLAIDRLDAVSVSNSVPEPESWTLMIIGATLVGTTMRLRRGHFAV